MEANDSDFLAVVFIMGGSCYGRSKDRAKAISRCWAEAKDFADVFGGFKKGAQVKLNVFDLSNTGVDQVTWHTGGFEADGKPLEVKPEIVVKVA
jgi:hypothetical protein